MRVKIAFTGRESRFAGQGTEGAWPLCDVCNEAITASRPGIVTFPYAELPKDVAVRVVHKKSCDNDQAAQWNDLEDFLRAVLAGLGSELPPAGVQGGGERLEDG